MDHTKCISFSIPSTGLTVHHYKSNFSIQMVAALLQAHAKNSFADTPDTWEVRKMHTVSRQQICPENILVPRPPRTLKCFHGSLTSTHRQLNRKASNLRLAKVASYLMTHMLVLLNAF